MSSRDTDNEVFFVEGWAKCARKGKRLDKDGSTSQGQIGVVGGKGESERLRVKVKGDRRGSERL